VVDATLGPITVAVLILAVLGIVALVRHLSNTRAPGGPASSLSDRAFQPIARHD